MDLEAKLKHPAVRQAIAYWVAQCTNMLGACKSEKQIKKALKERLQGAIGRPITEDGINGIYNIAVEEFEKGKQTERIVELISGPPRHMILPYGPYGAAQQN
jgi:hypothetical protein